MHQYIARGTTISTGGARRTIQRRHGNNEQLERKTQQSDLGRRNLSQLRPLLLVSSIDLQLVKTTNV